MKPNPSLGVVVKPIRGVFFDWEDDHPPPVLRMKRIQAGLVLRAGLEFRFRSCDDRPIDFCDKYADIVAQERGTKWIFSGRDGALKIAWSGAAEWAGLGVSSWIWGLDGSLR